MEVRPTPVLEAKQVGEVQARWAWTEPAVWTERMLTALEVGVKGGIWFSLIDKVYKPRNLRAAFAQVKANQGAAGVDHQTIEMFEADLETNLNKVSQQLADGSYRPQAVRRQWVAKKSDRLGYRRCVPEWWRRRCATCWSRFSNETLLSTATGFVRGEVAKTRCVVWTTCSKQETPGWLMLICKATSTPYRSKSCWSKWRRKWQTAECWSW